MDVFNKKNKDQEHRIGNIYRFKWSLDHFLLNKSIRIERLGNTNSFSSCILISESAYSTTTISIHQVVKRINGGRRSQPAGLHIFFTQPPGLKCGDLPHYIHIVTFIFYRLLDLWANPIERNMTIDITLEN